MAPVLVTLNDLEGHSPVAGLFKCNPSNILQYFTRFQLTARSRGPSTTAGLLVQSRFKRFQAAGLTLVSFKAIVVGAIREVIIWFSILVIHSNCVTILYRF